MRVYKEVLKERNGVKYSVEDVYKCISVARRLSNEGFLYVHENNKYRTLLTIDSTNSIFEKLYNTNKIKNEKINIVTIQNN